MNKKNLTGKIATLFKEEKWDKARKLLERQIKKHPEEHWFLSQLGETFYELRDYQKALELLQKSLVLSPTCPLTRWYLAGTFMMLDRNAEAIQYYQSLIEEDPKGNDCWEGTEWAESIKKDSLERIEIIRGFNASANV